MRVFISVPMHGRRYGNIHRDIDEAEEAIRKIFSQEENLEIVTTIDRKPPVGENPGRLWYLGQAISDLDGCDAVYFCPGWEGAKGCLVEHRVCELYDIQRIET